MHIEIDRHCPYLLPPFHPPPFRSSLHTRNVFSSKSNPLTPLPFLNTILSTTTTSTMVPSSQPNFLSPPRRINLRYRNRSPTSYVHKHRHILSCLLERLDWRTF